jgi:hypothetical protein
VSLDKDKSTPVHFLSQLGRAAGKQRDHRKGKGSRGFSRTRRQQLPSWLRK